MVLGAAILQLYHARQVLTGAMLTVLCKTMGTAFSTVFQTTNFPLNSPLSHCPSGLISALLVLSTMSLFTKVSLSPDIILCG